MTFQDYAMHYAKGLAASAANGAVAGVAAILGPPAANALRPVNIPALTPHQLLAVALGGFAMGAFNYLHAHPFPVEDPDQPDLPPPAAPPSPIIHNP